MYGDYYAKQAESMRKALLVLSACLLLLTSCSFRPLESSPDPEMPAPAAADDFFTYDGPVVVQVAAPEPLLTQKQLGILLELPHVLNVIPISIAHWLDASDEGSLCMIGLIEKNRIPEHLEEGGRWFRNPSECCVNQMEFIRLKNDPALHFRGLGDTVTYTEPEIVPDADYLGVMPEPISRTFTVVGVVEIEPQYDMSSFGRHHVFTTIDAVESMLGNYDYPGTEYRKSREDLAAYRPSAVAAARSGYAVYQPDPDHEGQMRFRDAEDRVYTEAEWRRLYAAQTVNAGYRIEVTLEHSRYYEDFADRLRKLQFSTSILQEPEDARRALTAQAHAQYAEYTKPDVVNGVEIPISDEERAKYDAWLAATLAKLEPDAAYTRLAELGELNDWFLCRFKPPYVVLPLRVEE